MLCRRVYIIGHGWLIGKGVGVYLISSSTAVGISHPLQKESNIYDKGMRRCEAEIIIKNSWKDTTWLPRSREILTHACMSKMWKVDKGREGCKGNGKEKGAFAASATAIMF
jgi:hypothetical protein